MAAIQLQCEPDANRLALTALRLIRLLKPTVGLPVAPPAP